MALAHEDGIITYDEMKDLMNNDDKLTRECEVMFATYDVDESGRLDEEEFKNLVVGVCGFIGLPLPPKEIYDDMFKDTDKDDDGTIDKEELKAFMKKLMECFIGMSEEEFKKMLEDIKKETEEENAKAVEAANAPPAAEPASDEDEDEDHESSEDEDEDENSDDDE